MSELFPLTVLEKFLYWEDRPAYPWCAFCKFELAGKLDRDAFGQAANEALSRHVLLRSKIVQQRNKLFWAPIDTAQAPIAWVDKHDTGIFPPLKHIDLRNEIGLQLVASEKDGKTDLVFGGHHVCADALGGASYARDVFINYANLVGESDEKIDLPGLNQAAIKNRGSFGMGWKQFFKQLPMQMIGLAGARQFVSRQPTPLVPHQADCGSDSPPGYPHVITSAVDQEATRSLRGTCKLQQCTLNELLARDLFIAINRWREQRNVDSSEWIRMAIPINVRTRETRNLPATNFVSSVFLDRRGDDFVNSTELLRGINGEMQLIKDNNLGMTFLFSLKLLDLIPGRLKKAATDDRCTSSCIFSNLDRHFLRLPFPKRDGKLLIGNLELQRAWTIAPVRPYSLTSFMSLVYDGQLLLTMHYDGRFLRPDAANELMDYWLEQIRNSSRSKD